MQNIVRKVLITSRSNSRSASKVQTLTGKDFPFRFLPNFGNIEIILTYKDIQDSIEQKSSALRSTRVPKNKEI